MENLSPTPDSDWKRGGSRSSRCERGKERLNLRRSVGSRLLETGGALNEAFDETLARAPLQLNYQELRYKVN